MCMSQKTDEKKPTTCRLEREYREVLEDRAKGLNLKLSDLVRQYVVAGLNEDATKVTLHQELPVLREDIKQLRRDFSLVAEVLLRSAGKLDKDAARNWAVRNLAAP